MQEQWWQKAAIRKITEQPATHYFHWPQLGSASTLSNDAQYTLLKLHNTPHTERNNTLLYTGKEKIGKYSALGSSG